MRFQFGSAFILSQICNVLITTVALMENEKSKVSHDIPLIQGVPILSTEARAARIAEFLASHHVPSNEHRKHSLLRNKQDIEFHPEPAHVDFKNFKSTGNIAHGNYEISQSGSLNKLRTYSGEDKLLADVRLSFSNPTTMLPIFTTSRDIHSYEFVPVNIIQEDSKESGFISNNNKNFEDLSDVSLVPAGSNTRIQVKKGPNGKDYEYEYIYYYYDEDDDGKTGVSATATNSQEILARTLMPESLPKVRGNPNRNKYIALSGTNNTSSITTTLEPVFNEIIPNGARKSENSHSEIIEERLPTNTRFPPRFRSNQATETTERSGRGRGNRQRSGLENVETNDSQGNMWKPDSNSGPEFPQNLPNGPIRFLGVTPNEDNDEKSTSLRMSNNSNKNKSASAKENYNEQSVVTRQRSVMEKYANPDEEQPHSNGRKKLEIHALAINSTTKILQSDRDVSLDTMTNVTEVVTTQVPHAMDKVALDLYAFLQQGSNNLVEFIKEIDENSMQLSTDSLSTDSPYETTTFYFDDTSFLITTMPTTAESADTSTTTTVTPLTVTTSQMPTTTNAEELSSLANFSRSKFKRPNVTIPVVSRNRFRSNTLPSSSEATSEPESLSHFPTTSTSRTRSRFSIGTTNMSNLKRTRPSLYSQKNQQEQLTSKEQEHKENVGKVNEDAKQVVAGRGRFRNTSVRSGPSRTKTASTNEDKLMIATSNPGTIDSSDGSIFQKSVFNKLNGINRRRGNRPVSFTTAPSTANEDTFSEQIKSSTLEQEKNPELQKSQFQQVNKVPGVRIRPKVVLHKPLIKSGAVRIGSLRTKPIHLTNASSTETISVGNTSSNPVLFELVSEGTEEESREALAESSLPATLTTLNPLNKLRDRNKIQVHLMTTTVRSLLAPLVRRSHLLPRRKTTEVPLIASSELAENIITTQKLEVTESSTTVENINSPTISSVKSELETRGLSSLLAPRRRIVPKRLGQSKSIVAT